MVAGADEVEQLVALDAVVRGDPRHAAHATSAGDTSRWVAGPVPDPHPAQVGAVGVVDRAGPTAPTGCWCLLLADLDLGQPGAAVARPDGQHPRPPRPCASARLTLCTGGADESSDDRSAARRPGRAREADVDDLRLAARALRQGPRVVARRGEVAGVGVLEVRVVGDRDGGRALRGPDREPHVAVAGILRRRRRSSPTPSRGRSSPHRRTTAATAAASPGSDRPVRGDRTRGRHVGACRVGAGDDTGQLGALVVAEHLVLVLLRAAERHPVALPGVGEGRGVLPQARVAVEDRADGRPTDDVGTPEVRGLVDAAATATAATAATAVLRPTTGSLNAALPVPLALTAATRQVISWEMSLSVTRYSRALVPGSSCPSRSQPQR